MRRYAEWGDITNPPRVDPRASRWVCRLKTCGALIDPASRRWSWCSRRCEITAQLLAGIGVRRLVWERDKGVCALCGVDTEWLRTVWTRLYGVTPNRLRLGWKLRGRKPLTRSWWEADHARPVVEGGGTCPLDNYRTLCIPCHARVTAELATRRAALGRAAQTRPSRACRFGA